MKINRRTKGLENLGVYMKKIEPDTKHLCIDKKGMDAGGEQ